MRDGPQEGVLFFLYFRIVLLILQYLIFWLLMAHAVSNSVFKWYAIIKLLLYYISYTNTIITSQQSAMQV